ncbi:MAG: UvrD-helicase domain-containing protein [Helicobacteraceae bacterium]|nr:UvrD-helicase domain-containing protein [Helicobacteraceae bacterium]
MNDILADLNDEQKEAVLHLDGALLILAGAGSGKTKTLTTRLAYLIDCVGIDPSSTLTLTFTNKAASEMRNRALNLISNANIAPPLLCTFHRFGLLFLKFHIDSLGRKPNFVLLDNDDKKRVLKLFNSNIQTNVLNSEISNMKNLLISPDVAMQSVENSFYREVARIYKLYNEYLLEKNMLDFDDLLLLSYEVLDKNESLCKKTSQKYNYIMVDEYQDTNLLQYKLLKKLCLCHNNICVVGDDDQSIYGFRGADIKNILDFARNFNDAKIIKLEKNYRSTNEILNAANNLISFNTKRLGKKLKSVVGDGKKVEVLESSDEKDEAKNIIWKIKKLLQNGVGAENIAILFRLNSLSRSIEERLNKEGIPYKLIGAVRFYERAEIKDILSYFRLVINFDDDFSFLRIINRPKRGIGKVTQEKLESFARSKGVSIYGAISNFKDEIPLQAKHINSIVGIFDTLNDLKDRLEISPIEFLEYFKDRIKILDTFENIQDEIDREANIDEFYGSFRDYIEQNPTFSLEDFLNDISLSSDSDANINNAVSCMSVHSSKGLEFEHLFVIGLEDGFFPILRESTDLEEERRLGYVAITRAKSELILSFVKSRFHKGKRELLRKSRFLAESGVLQKNNNRIYKNTKLDSNDNRSKADSFKTNDLVMHKLFGAGRIMEISGSGNNTKLKINFGGNVKNILSSFVERI